MLNDPLFILVALAVVSVAAILLFGIGGFAAKVDGKRSNKVMRLRIVAQLVAVALILLFVYLRGGN